MSDDEKPPPPEPKIFESRNKWSIGVTGGTALSMTICVIGFGVAHKAAIDASDVKSFKVSISGACAIQSVFGIFVTIMLVQIITLAISWIAICCNAKKDFYRLNMVAHTACLIAIFVGCIIFGIKAEEAIPWYFWFAVIAAFCCVGNMVIWFPSQYMRRREKMTKLTTELKVRNED